MKELYIIYLHLVFVLNIKAQTHLDQTFRELEGKWLNSWKNKDIKTAGALMDDKFHLVSSLTKGELIDKKGALDIIKEKSLEHFSIDSLKVQLHGNTAIVSVWLTQSAQTDGRDWSGKFIVTDTWLQINKTWKVICRHSTWLDKH